MDRIAVITDSMADLDKQTIEKYGIELLRLKVIVKDKTYVEGVDITADEVFKEMKSSIVTTSVPSVDEVTALFDSLARKNYTHAIFITVSSGLSSTANQISMVSQHFKGIQTFIFDSKSISMGQGVQVIECAKMVESGDSFEHITETLPEIRSRVKVYFLVPTLEYLVKGGRIGRVTGVIGQILSIKPIISVGEDGKYYTVETARGWNVAISKIVSKVKELLLENKLRVFIRHSANEADANKIFDALKHESNITFLDVGEISVAASVHSGPGLIGIALYQEYKGD